MQQIVVQLSAPWNNVFHFHLQTRVAVIPRKVHAPSIIPFRNKTENLEPPISETYGRGTKFSIDYEMSNIAHGETYDPVR